MSLAAVWCSLALLALAAATPHRRDIVNGVCTDCQTWGYVPGNSQPPYGPSFWNNVPGAQCGGNQQSPINISPKDVITGVTLDTLQRFWYGRKGAWLYNNGFDIRVMNRKTTPIGDQITFRGHSYTLNSVQLHVPGLHAINFVNYDMEIHLYHTAVDATKDPTSFIIAIPVQLSSTSANVVLGSLCDQLSQLNAAGNVSAAGPNGGYATGSFFPDVLDYFYYQGSLTQPPCTQNVEWAVLMNPIKVSSSCQSVIQETLFNNYKNAAGASNATRFNARPPQALNGRTVAYTGTLPFTLPGLVTQTSANTTNIILILVACVLGVIGLAALVVVLLVVRASKKNNSEDNIPLHPLAE